MQTIKRIIKTGFLLLIVTALTQCKKTVEENNDNEIITTVELHFTPQGGGTTKVFSFNDPDGDGGANPAIDEIQLTPSTVYSVSLVLLDKTKNPVENINEEIEAEGQDHRFYFEPSSGSNITVSNLSNDANGIPLGLQSAWTTGAAATGTLKLTLRHYESGGKALADPVNSNKSASDVEVTFATRIQ